MKNSIYIFLFFFPLYVLSMGGHGYGGVGTTTYDVTRSILLHRSFAISQVPWGKFGSNGRFYAQYGIGHSLYNIPFYSLGHVLTKQFPALSPQYDRITMFSTLLGQPFISALTCSLLFLFCRRLGYSSKISTQCALLYGAGTQVWMYAQLDFSEPILTFFLLGTAYWIYGPKQTSRVSETPQVLHIILSGLFLGIAIMVKIVSLILFPLFLLYILYGRHPKELSRLKKIMLFVISVIVFGLATVAAYNLIRFGNPFETGYDNEFNFWYKHILSQLWNNLFGLEGSIFFYSPVILLASFGVFTFYKKYRTFSLFIFGIILTFFIFYPFTTNELYYGPRYLIPTLPFFMLIAGAALAKVRKPWKGSMLLKLHKFCIAVLLILGILQQLLGVVVNYHTYYWRIQYTMPLANETIHSSPPGKILLSTPNLPHIRGHFWLVKHAVRDIFQPGGLPLSGVKLMSDSTQHNAWIPYYGIDLWWCNPNVVRMAGWIFSGMIVVVLIGVMSLALYRLVKIKC